MTLEEQITAAVEAGVERALRRVLEERPVNDSILTTDQAAESCGRAEKTVREWCRAGSLPATKRGGGWRIRRTDLDRYLAGETPPSVALLTRVD
jgi:excisionase family DNA binding protein